MLPKYRAWDKIQKKMVQVYGMSFDKNGILKGIKDEYTEEGEIHLIYDVNNYELMQATGLKDDDGQDLYEGDIFVSRFSNLVYVVYLDKEKASFWIKSEAGDHPLFALTPFHPRIIGNIYENKDLLEEHVRNYELK